jgi:ferredoxin
MIRIPAVDIVKLRPDGSRSLHLPSTDARLGYPVGVPILRFLPSERSLRVSRGTPLTDAIRRAGLPLASGCEEELICAKCGVRIVRGLVSPETGWEREAKRRNRVESELRLACGIRVYSDLVVATDYWGASGGR